MVGLVLKNCHDEPLKSYIGLNKCRTVCLVFIDGMQILQLTLEYRQLQKLKFAKILIYTLETMAEIHQDTKFKLSFF